MGSCNTNNPGSNNSIRLSIITIYPNPFKDQLTLKGFPNDNLSIEIFDIFGRLSYIKDVHSSITQNINTENLNSDLYIVRIRNSDTGKVVAKRIIVKR